MFGVGTATRIYLAAGSTDMRKSFDGLYGLVRDRLLCDPLSGHIFLFANARRNRLGCLTVLGVPVRNHVVGLLWTEIGSDCKFNLGTREMNIGREAVAQS